MRVVTVTWSVTRPFNGERGVLLICDSWVYINNYLISALARRRPNVLCKLFDYFWPCGGWDEYFVGSKGCPMLGREMGI